jgi:predicted RNA polymerase sigma factor
MLLAAARGPARSTAEGVAVALPDQDRATWDAAMIAEGRGLAAEALAARPLTSLAIQAAIQAVHAAAPTAAETDWQQILALYDALLLRDASPAVRLGRAVAVGIGRGPLAGLAELSVLSDDARVAHDPRLLAVRAGLLEQSGATDQAASAYAEAARMTTNAAERRWLDERARRARRTGEEPR